MNWFKTGDIEVCEAMEDHKDSEKGNKMATCMMNLFGLGTSCPIEQVGKVKKKKKKLMNGFK